MRNIFLLTLVFFTMLLFLHFNLSHVKAQINNTHACNQNSIGKKICFFNNISPAPNPPINLNQINNNRLYTCTSSFTWRIQNFCCDNYRALTENSPCTRIEGTGYFVYCIGQNTQNNQINCGSDDVAITTRRNYKCNDGQITCAAKKFQIPQDTTFRTGPGINYAPYIIRKDTQIELLANTPDNNQVFVNTNDDMWIKVKVDSREEGWMSVKAINGGVFLLPRSQSGATPTPTRGATNISFNHSCNLNSMNNIEKKICFFNNISPAPNPLITLTNRNNNRLYTCTFDSSRLRFSWRSENSCCDNYNAPNENSPCTRIEQGTGYFVYCIGQNTQNNQINCGSDDVAITTQKNYKCNQDGQITCAAKKFKIPQNIRLRTEPGINHSTIDIIRQGTEIELLANTPDNNRVFVNTNDDYGMWIKVKVDSREGWMNVKAINGDELPPTFTPNPTSSGGNSSTNTNISNGDELPIFQSEETTSSGENTNNNSGATNTLTPTNTITPTFTPTPTPTNIPPRQDVCGPVDVNNDSRIDIIDFSAFARKFNSICR